jgi:hypothetical protein
MQTESFDRLSASDLPPHRLSSAEAEVLPRGEACAGLDDSAKVTVRVMSGEELCHVRARGATCRLVGHSQRSRLCCAGIRRWCRHCGEHELYSAQSTDSGEAHGRLGSYSAPAGASVGTRCQDTSSVADEQPSIQSATWLITG